jgi:hypothetical protein
MLKIFPCPPDGEMQILSFDIFGTTKVPSSDLGVDLDL